VDGYSAECVKPHDNSICSSNFTSAIASPAITSKHGGVASSITAGMSASALSSSVGSSCPTSRGLSSGQILAIVLPTMAVVGLVILSRYYWHKRGAKARRRPKDSTSSHLGEMMINESELVNIGRDMTVTNTYHIDNIQTAMIGE
jgi:hypothetical protein